MHATQLRPYRVVSNGSFRLALCLGHNFYLPLVDFLLDFHSPQAIVTNPLKNSRTALLEVGQDWVGEGREWPVSLPFFPHVEILICPSIAGHVSSAHLHGSVCACTRAHALWSPPCALSPNSQRLQLFSAQVPSAYWSTVPAQEESLRLYVPQGSPSPVPTRRLWKPSSLPAVRLILQSSLGTRLKLCLRGPPLGLSPFLSCFSRSACWLPLRALP